MAAILEAIADGTWLRLARAIDPEIGSAPPALRAAVGRDVLVGCLGRAVCGGLLDAGWHRSSRWLTSALVNPDGEDVDVRQLIEQALDSADPASLRPLLAASDPRDKSMSHQRPALRVALLGVAAALVGFAVIAAFLGWQAHDYSIARQGAVAVAAGTIVEDGLGDSGDIRVRWADRSGREHLQRFSIYNTDRYTKGATFQVAYDPAHPSGQWLPR